MVTHKTLLYVEDDQGSRKVMQMLVSTLPQAVQLAIFDDSTDFMERLAALNPVPDVFLLDIHVSPHNGFGMLAMLRQHPHYAEKMVIALTASVMNEEINQLKEAGFDGVLAKPLNFHTFPDTMLRILAGEHIWTVHR
ncbi:MAG: response regulator, partial [Anaerolineae bacterium]|nr:response regulator [Anaerolineae bacterium]